MDHFKRLVITILKAALVTNENDIINSIIAFNSEFSEYIEDEQFFDELDYLISNINVK